MKKRIHPYLEPKLIIHTNGSTYLTGIPLFWLRSAAPVEGAQSAFPEKRFARALGGVENPTEATPESPSIGEEALLCFQGVSSRPQGTQPAKQNFFFFQAKKRVQQHLFTSYLIKYLDFSSSVRSIACTLTAELQIIQPIYKKICFILDTDTISNPL